jgi:hypothetical protein
MKLIYLYLFSILFATCQNRNIHRVDKLALGNVLNGRVYAASEQILVLESPSQSSPAITYIENEIVYEVCTDENLKVRRISTHDLNFKSSENYSMATTYGEIDSAKKSKGYMVNGWNYVVPLKNNWKVVFFDSLILVNKTVRDSCHVQGFYTKKNN